MLSAYLLALISGTQASASGSVRRSICAGFSPGPCWKTPWVATSETRAPALAQHPQHDGERGVDRVDGADPGHEVGAPRVHRAVHPVVVGGQVELARAAGDAGALLDRHQPLVLAQVLAGLARQAVQVREGAVDLGEDLVELLLRDRRVGAQRVEEGALPVEFLQQVALQVRAARHLEDLEDPGEAGVVVVRAVVVQEEVDAVVEILEAEQRPHALVQGIFVGDHGRAEPRGCGTTFGIARLWGIRPVLDKSGPVTGRRPAQSRACRRSHCARSCRGLAAVPQHLVGRLQAAPARPLGGHDAPALPRPRGRSGPRSRATCRASSQVDDDDALEPAGPGPGLEEQGHDEDRVGPGGRGEAAPRLLADERVQDAPPGGRAPPASEKASARIAPRSSAPPRRDDRLAERLAKRRERRAAGRREARARSRRRRPRAAPSAARKPAAVDLPEPMPPVSPMTRDSRREAPEVGDDRLAPPQEGHEAARGEVGAEGDARLAPLAGEPDARRGRPPRPSPPTPAG